MTKPHHRNVVNLGPDIFNFGLAIFETKAREHLERKRMLLEALITDDAVPGSHGDPDCLV